MNRGYRIIVPLILATGLHALDEGLSADLELTMTPGFRVAALGVPPLSLIRDPAAAATIAHIRSQLVALDGSVVVESGLPALLPLVEHVEGAVIHFAQPKPGWFMNGMVLAMDVGPAAEGLAGWMKTIAAVGAEADRWEDFTGFSYEPFFFGRNGSRFVWGEFDRLEAPVRQLSLLKDPAVPSLEMMWNLAPLVAALGKRPQPWPLEGVFGAWRGTRPIARACIRPHADGWHGSVAIEGLGRLPLANLDDQVAAAARSGRSITLGAHLDPFVAHGMMFWMVRTLLGGQEPTPFAKVVSQWAYAIAPQPPGQGGGASLIDHLTGDCLMQAGWNAGPVLTGALLLTLYDGGESAAAVSDLARRMDAVAAVRQDADQCFTLVTALGTTVIARRGARLVVGSDEALIAAWLADVPGDAPLAFGRIVQLDLDLPAIATHWLPKAWPLLAEMKESLGNDPLAVVDKMMVDLRSQLVRVERPASVGGLLSHDAAQIPYLAEELARVFPGPDLVAAVDAGCALYMPDQAQLQLLAPNEEGPPALLVLRFAEGFAVFGEERQTGLDATALAAVLAGWKHLIGPPPEALTVLATPEPAVFDRRWLPSLEAVLRHVPIYHLELTGVDFAMRVEERGLPLAGLAAIAAGLEIWNNLP